VQLLLIYKNILLFAKKHKLLFSIYVAVQIISLVATLYVFSIFRANVDYAKNVFTSLRMFSVDFFNTDIKKIINDIDAFILENESLIDGLSLMNDSLNLQVDVISNENYSELSNGRSINEKNEIVLSILHDDMFGYTPIGSEIEFFYRNYIVVGKTWFHSIVDIASVIDIVNEIKPNKMIFYTNTIPDIFAIDYITNSVMENFIGAVVEPPNVLTQSADVIIEYIIIIAVFAISLLNAAYLYKYVLETRDKYIKIMRICGFHRLRSIISILIENIVILFGMFAVCFAITHFNMSSIVSFITVSNREYSLALQDYIIVFTVYLVLFMIIFSSTIRKTLTHMIKGDNR